MSDKEISTKWCNHGNTNHVYCAECEVETQQQLIEDQAKEIERLMWSNGNLRTYLELAVKALEEIRSLTWNGVEPLTDINAIAGDTISSIRNL